MLLERLTITHFLTGSGFAIAGIVENMIAIYKLYEAGNQVVTIKKRTKRKTGLPK